MGNCCFGDEDKVEDNEPDERTRLLPETRPVYSAPDEINAEQTEPTENDEQAVLSRIVQEAQESLIDVSAFDQHALEHHEYVDRSRMYATRINNEFERQIRDAIQKTARTRGVTLTAAASASTAQRFADLQTETQPDEAELMQQLAAEFRQRLASCGIRSAGDLVVRVTGERNGQPMFIGQVPLQNGGPYLPTAVAPNGLLPNVAHA